MMFLKKQIYRTYFKPRFPQSFCP